jgi:hypothetical protein
MDLKRLSLPHKGLPPPKKPLNSQEILVSRPALEPGAELEDPSKIKECAFRDMSQCGSFRPLCPSEGQSGGRRFS